MKNRTDVNRLIMANVLVSGSVVAWLVLAEDPPLLTAMAVILAFALSSFFGTMALRSWRRSRVHQCELCNRKKGVPTDNTEWAHRHGLEICNNCAFKLQIAFNNAEPPNDGRVIH